MFAFEFYTPSQPPGVLKFYKHAVCLFSVFFFDRKSKCGVSRYVFQFSMFIVFYLFFVYFWVIEFTKTGIDFQNNPSDVFIIFNWK